MSIFAPALNGSFYNSLYIGNIFTKEIYNEETQEMDLHIFAKTFGGQDTEFSDEVAYGLITGYYSPSSGGISMPLTVTVNGNYLPSSYGYNSFSSVDVDVINNSTNLFTVPFQANVSAPIWKFNVSLTNAEVNHKIDEILDNYGDLDSVQIMYSDNGVNVLLSVERTYNNIYIIWIGNQAVPVYCSEVTSDIPASGWIYSLSGTYVPAGTTIDVLNADGTVDPNEVYQNAGYQGSINTLPTEFRAPTIWNNTSLVGKSEIIEKTVTVNGEYNPSDDGVQAYSKVIVNV